MAEAKEMEAAPQDDRQLRVNFKAKDGNEEEQIFLRADMTEDQQRLFDRLSLVQARQKEILGNAQQEIDILASAEKDFKGRLFGLLGVELPEPEEAPPEGD